MARFKGAVPAHVLVPHIAAMFFGMLFANAAALSALARREQARRQAWVAFLLLAVGGLLLGPAVQKYAFGAWWTGWPFGHDLTDNKTAIAVIAWGLALVASRGLHGGGVGRLGRLAIVVRRARDPGRLPRAAQHVRLRAQGSVSRARSRFRDYWKTVGRKPQGRGELLLSPVLDGALPPRPVQVYLPPGYRDGRDRFPVLYLQDGQNLFDPATAFAGTWQAERALRPARPAGAAGRRAWGSPTPGCGASTSTRRSSIDATAAAAGAAYLEWLIGTVQPLIEKQFRVARGRESTGIAGASMGGLISLYAFGRFPERFGLVGGMSPSLFFGDEALDALDREPPARRRARLPRHRHARRAAEPAPQDGAQVALGRDAPPAPAPPGLREGRLPARGGSRVDRGARRAPRRSRLGAPPAGDARLSVPGGRQRA